MQKRFPCLKLKVSFSFNFRLEIGSVVVTIRKPRAAAKKPKSR